MRVKPVDDLDRRYHPLRLFLDRKPAGIPQAYWSRLRKLRALVVIAGAVNIAAVGVGLLVLLERADVLGIDVPVMLLGASAAVLVGVGIMEIAPQIIKRRFLKHLVKHEYRVCLHCGYLLAQLPEKHRCPECGSEYDVNEIREEWERWEPRVHV